MITEPLAQLRRQNFALLVGEFVASNAVQGVTVRSGLERAFAVHLQVHSNWLSQWKRHRPISDRSARHIEVRCGKEVGWLDRDHTAQGGALHGDETLAMDTVRGLWRDGDAASRRILMATLQSLREMQPGLSNMAQRSGATEPEQR